MAEMTQAARDEFRARFLLACYRKHGTKQVWEKDGGLIAVGVELARELGFANNDAVEAYKYLAQRGLITTTTQGGGAVTPAGQDVAEGLLRKTEAPPDPGVPTPAQTDLDERQKAALSGLDERNRALSEINASSWTLGEGVAADRYHRWKSATVRFLTEHFRDEVVKGFRTARPARHWGRGARNPPWVDDGGRALSFLGGLAVDVQARPQDVLRAGTMEVIVDKSEADPPGESAIRLFVAHASLDAAFTETIVTLLKDALSLPPELIRCTSVDGLGLPGGVDTDDQLRKEVLQADLVLGIISTSSLASLYVAFELGARWGKGGPLIPLLAPGADPSSIKGPLGGKNALRGDNAAQLHLLVDGVGKHLAIKPHGAATYQAALDAVLKFATRAKEAPAPATGLSASGIPFPGQTFEVAYGIAWVVGLVASEAYCEGCRTGAGKWVQMSYRDAASATGVRGVTGITFRTYTCPHGHPPITLGPQQPPPPGRYQRATMKYQHLIPNGKTGSKPPED